MATITSAGTGDWSAGATWVGGVAPTAADSATILDTHVVSLSGTCVCLSLVINQGGKLSHHASNNSTFTVQNGITVGSVAASSNGQLSIDLSGTATQTCTIILNNAAGAVQTLSIQTGSSFILKGYQKTRWTTLTADVAVSATTASVAAATGWRTGDRFIFATTQAYNATVRADNIAGTNTVSGTSLSNLTAMTYAHLSGGYVGNFSSNLTVKSGGANGVVIASAESLGHTTVLGRTVTDVSFEGITVQFAHTYLAETAYNPWTECSNNSFYVGLAAIAGIEFYRHYQQIPRANNIFYMATGANALNHLAGGNAAINCGISTDDVVFRAAGGIVNAGYGSTYIRPKISGTSNATTGAISLSAGVQGLIVRDADIFSNATAIVPSNGSCLITDSRIGTQYAGAVANSSFVGSSSNYVNIDIINTQTQTTYVPNVTQNSSSSAISVLSKNSDITLQEQYQLYGNSYRENSVINRGTSSVRFEPKITTASILAASVFKLVSALCLSGVSYRFIGYARRDTATTTLKITVDGISSTITGTDVTANVWTAPAGLNTWILFNITVSQSAGYSQLLNLKLESSDSASTTALAYFDGLPLYPWVNKVRHYGFLFDETSAVRTGNSTISASEATAAAYTGITVTWGASASSISAISSDQTFQKLYDYTQAQGCLNIPSVMPLTGVGVAGSPSLFAAGNITINTGSKINGAGSISMGSYTLSSELAGAVAYTYTGGTWSQVTTVPTVNGGQLNIGAAGTYTLNMGGSTIYSMTPSAPGTYILSAGSFTGTVDLRNTTAHAITVQLPVGASSITTNNTGALITVVQAATVGVRVTTLALDTSAPVQNARVYLLAASGGPLSAGTVILSGLTDVNGVYENAAFTYSSNQPVVGKVRKSTGSPLYKTAPLSGNITAGGYSATAFMVGDEA